MAPLVTRAGHERLPLGTTERRPLDLRSLRADLAALWREEGRGVTRACHATLVVSVSSADALGPLLEDILGARPSRTILLETGTAVPAGEIEAWASGSCFRDPSGTSLICSERVWLATGPDTDNRVASVVRSLTVGGLPLEVLVLEGSPRRLGWVTGLGSEIDRVIYRSAGMTAGESAKLWGPAREAAAEPRLDDITWAELDGWRDTVASSFDGDASPLGGLRRVELVVEGGPERLSPALLFTGWLGSRLGWRDPARGRKGAWTLSDPRGGKVAVEVGVARSSTPVAALTGVRLEFEDGIPSREWLESGPDRAPESGGGVRGRVRPTMDSFGVALLRVLRRPARDDVVRESLRLASALAEVEAR